MITLKTEKYEAKYDYNKPDLDKVINLQKELGLGDPSEFVKGFNLKSKEKDYLLENFRKVEDPIKKYPLLNEKTFQKLPQYGTVQLIKDRTKISCKVVKTDRWRNIQTTESYEAAIPLIPATLLELCRRVKNNVGNAKFYMVFEPSWKLVGSKTIPLRKDPVILARLDNDWFELGRYDKDANFIKL